MGTGVGVALISLYVNYASYKNLWLGKMMIFAVFGALMFLYGGIRLLLEKPVHKEQGHHKRVHHAPPHAKPHVNPKFCPGCGKHVGARARFCHGCGRKLH